MLRGRDAGFEVLIGNLDDAAKTVYARYRPLELQIDKTMQWVKNQNIEQGNELQLLFTKPEGRETSLEFFFDAVESKNTSVGDAINALTFLTNARIQDANGH